MRDLLIVFAVLPILLTPLFLVLPEEVGLQLLFVLSLMWAVGIGVLIPIYLWRNKREWFWGYIMLLNILGGINRCMGG